MLTAFAVQTLIPGNAGPEFIIVGADNAQDALAAAAQECMKTGKEDAQMIAVFTHEDLSLLMNNMETAKQRLAEQDQ